MRFEDVVDIYGNNVAGRAKGFENYEAAKEAFKKFFDISKVNEDSHCLPCEMNGHRWKPGEDVEYHIFLVREDMMAEILQNCEFEFRKRKGMGRTQPKEWIKEQVAAGQELWFTLRFLPNYE